MEKILTISIAAYNVEKYLSQTIESLIVSDVIDDLEIYICDDGGNDSSLAIAQKFEKLFPQSIHAIHKENGGYGSVYNYIISIASGKYFKLLDGDDMFDKAGLIDVIHRLKNSDSDVIVTNYYSGLNFNTLEKVMVFDEYRKGIYRISDFVPQKPIGMWAIIYKTDVLRKCKLTLPEHTLYTDQLYSTIPFSKAETIELYPANLYCYRIGYEEQSASRTSRIKHTDEMLEICKMTSVFAENNNAHDNNKYILWRASIYHTIGIRTILLGDINKSNHDKLRKFDQFAKQNALSVYKESQNQGKIGKLIKAFRITNYALYWMLRFIPGGISNWQ